MVVKVKINNDEIFEGINYKDIIIQLYRQDYIIATNELYINTVIMCLDIVSKDEFEKVMKMNNIKYEYVA